MATLGGDGESAIVPVTPKEPALIADDLAATPQPQRPAATPTQPAQIAEDLVITPQPHSGSAMQATILTFDHVRACSGQAMNY